MLTRPGRPGMSSIAATLLTLTFTLGLAACASPAPSLSSAPPPTAVPTVAQSPRPTPSAGTVVVGPNGSPLPTPTREIPLPRPDRVTCERIVREDVRTARAFRQDVGRSARISADAGAIARAASDPGSDIATWGIPLLPDELAAIDAAGIAHDATAAAATVVWYRPDLFAGMWIDRGMWNGDPVVGVVRDRPEAVARVACVIPPDVDAHLVVRDVSMDVLQGVADRVAAAIPRLAEEGISIVMVDADEVRGVVMVGVTGRTDEIEERLRAEFGALVVVEEQEPITW